MRKWTEEEVKEYFDTHWDVSLLKLSHLSGHSMRSLKQLLMSDS